MVTLQTFKKDKATSSNKYNARHGQAAHKQGNLAKSQTFGHPIIMGIFSWQYIDPYSMYCVWPAAFIHAVI